MNKLCAVAACLLLCVVTCCSATYYHDEGVKLWKYTQVAYCDPASIQAWNCDFCNQTLPLETKIFYDAPTDTLAYGGISHPSNEILVVFRGTRSLENWITDLKFHKTKASFVQISGALVHDGFLSAYTTLSSQLLAYVKTALANNPGYRVTATGHSLGAALSTLLAADLVFGEGMEPVYQYSFGSPRVGNANFSDAYDSKVKGYRVVHEADIVPHLPPYDFGFHHVSTEVWLHNGNDKVCNGSGEDNDCSDSLLLPVSVADHKDYYGISGTC